jgi:hypothetical protein
MTTFKTIRQNALETWYSGLSRTRVTGKFSDDYSDSTLCKWQRECTDDNKHCSFLCSLGDWLSNISDVLHDDRFDELNLEDDEDAEKEEALFRYYTRFLLLVSEVIEDFVVLNQKLKHLNTKGLSGNDLENGILRNNELKDISEFINSVCKHKTERDNLHVHNHHLGFRFEDFDDNSENNQIRLGHLNIGQINMDTTVLVPKLTYFINVIVAVNNKVDNCIATDIEYKRELHELFVDEWHSS